jgi:hypothetical protein
MKKGRRGKVPGTLFHPDPAGGCLQIERKMRQQDFPAPGGS